MAYQVTLRQVRHDEENYPLDMLVIWAKTDDIDISDHKEGRFVYTKLEEDSQGEVDAAIDVKIGNDEGLLT